MGCISWARRIVRRPPLLIKNGQLSMDYFSATVLVTPVWIALGGLAVLFTRRLLWLYLVVCMLLAIISWTSGVGQVREQRSFEERQVALQTEQQQLNAEFQRI